MCQINGNDTSFVGVLDLPSKMITLWRILGSHLSSHARWPWLDFLDILSLAPASRTEFGEAMK